jgi:hypothetical protein
MRVYECENGRKAQTQPARSWWLDSQTREDFDRAVAHESLRMRGMKTPPARRKVPDGCDA